MTVNGNNKTITGLNDMLFAGTWAGKSGLIINNLTIKDSNIANDVDDVEGTVGVGAFIGYPQASAVVTLNNCHLVNSKVSGGHWTGGLIGAAAGYSGTDGPVFMNLTIKDCSVTGSTINDKGSVGGVIGHGAQDAWTNVTITNTTVTGNTITSTGSSTNRAGSVMGTIGAAGQPTTTNGVILTGGVSVEATVSNNEVKSNGTAITTIYGRQGTETGVLTLTGGTYDSKPVEENASYIVVEPDAKIVCEDKIEYYGTVTDALNAAEDGETINLLWTEGDEPIAMNGAVYGKTVTITGTANVDWSKGFLFIGRGGEGDGKVIFENAKLTSDSNSASYGIHVSGREKNADDKYDGTLVINDSKIELDYLINKGTMTLDNSTLTVKNGFSIGGRPAEEIEASEIDGAGTLAIDDRNLSEGIYEKVIGDASGFAGALEVVNNDAYKAEIAEKRIFISKNTHATEGGSTGNSGNAGNSGSSGNHSDKKEESKEPTEVYYASGATTQTNAAKTGDASNALLWVCIMGAALIAVVTVFSMKKKSEK